MTEVGPLPDGGLSWAILVGMIAVFPIRPRYKSAWPVAIAAAKRHIYQCWQPNSEYLPAGSIDDFELHDELSLRHHHPKVELYVSVKPTSAMPAPA